MKNSPEPARYAVVGDPVAHSLSPLIHNAWMVEAGLDAHYERVHLKSETVAADIRDMARAYSGINVTLPHKIAALEASANSSPEARVVGAANTLVRAGDGWTAHNTDVAGFEIAMRAVAGEEGNRGRTGEPGGWRDGERARGARAAEDDICRRDEGGVG